MFSWIITNYKKAIAFITAIITVIAVPLWMSAFGLIVDIKTAIADVSRHEVRIKKLETTINNIDGKFEVIEGYLQRLEDREYQELKQARQLRQANKP